MSYLGRGSNLTRKAQDKVSFLATAGQTVRTGLSYVPTHVDVTVNGITLTEITDYTATNGNSITFSVALALNDEVTIVSSKTFDVANHYTISAANALLAAKATNTAVAAKAPLASPVFTGNVGVGVTPEDWNANYTALRLGTRTALYNTTAGNAETTVLSNNYVNSSSEQHIQTGPASRYQQYNGTHRWVVSPSASAGALPSDITAMTIDISGRVTIPNQPALSIRHNTGPLNFAVGDSFFATTGVIKHTDKGGITHNTSNGRFTVPVAGTYHVGFHTMQRSGAAGFYLALNGTGLTQIYDSNEGDYWNNQAASMIMTCAANDYISIICAQNNAANDAHGSIHTELSIHLIG